MFRKEDGYSRRRWRQIQYLADVFWRRWIREYLPQLQERQKWAYPSRNFAVNDIVLVIDDRVPRSSWPLGRITSVRKNSVDGHVRRKKLPITSFPKSFSAVVLSVTRLKRAQIFGNSLAAENMSKTDNYFYLNKLLLQKDSNIIFLG